MSALTDLNDALARLAAEQTAVDVVTKATSLAVTDLVAEVQNLLAAQGSGDTAAIESAVTGINSVVASLNAAEWPPRPENPTSCKCEASQPGGIGSANAGQARAYGWAGSSTRH